MTDNKQYYTDLQIKDLIRNKSLIKKLYNGNENEFAKFLKKILSDEKYDPFSQAEIAGDELRRWVDREADTLSTILEEVIIKDKEFLLKVLSNCLKRAIVIKQGFDWHINGIYMKNIEEISSGTRRVKITRMASIVMRDSIWEYPKSYFSRLFIRYAYMPPGDEFVFDPFILDYFSDIESLNAFLTSTKLVESFNDNQEDRYFYNIVIGHFKNYIKNNKKAIKIQDKQELTLITKYIDFK